MCAAPAGNQFWKLRSKHGRDKLFATPDLLWKAACEYFEWCDANPLIEIDFRGKDSERVELPKMRAYTIHGLCRYLDCNIDYVTQFQSALVDKKDELSLDFSRILTCIREIIYDQKFTGAAAGFLNANLIIRDLSLRDKQDVAVTAPQGLSVTYKRQEGNEPLEDAKD